MPNTKEEIKEALPDLIRWEGDLETTRKAQKDFITDTNDSYPEIPVQKYLLGKTEGMNPITLKKLEKQTAPIRKFALSHNLLPKSKADLVALYLAAQARARQGDEEVWYAFQPAGPGGITAHSKLAQTSPQLKKKLMGKEKFTDEDVVNSAQKELELGEDNLTRLVRPERWEELNSEQRNTIRVLQHNLGPSKLKGFKKFFKAINNESGVDTTTAAFELLNTPRTNQVGKRAFEEAEKLVPKESRKFFDFTPRSYETIKKEGMSGLTKPSFDQTSIAGEKSPTLDEAIRSLSTNKALSLDEAIQALQSDSQQPSELDAAIQTLSPSQPQPPSPITAPEILAPTPEVVQAQLPNQPILTPQNVQALAPHPDRPTVSQVVPPPVNYIPGGPGGIPGAALLADQARQTRELQAAGRGPQYGQALLSGTKKTLIPLAIGLGDEAIRAATRTFDFKPETEEKLNLAAEALGEVADLKGLADPNFEPITTGEKAMQLLGYALDPAIGPAMSLFGKATGPLLSKGLSASRKPLEKTLSQLSKPGRITSKAAEDFAAKTNQKLAQIYLTERTLKPALELGLTELTAGAAEAARDEKLGAGYAVARGTAGALGGGLFGGLGRIFEAGRVQGRASYAFDGAKVSPDVMDKAKEMAAIKVRDYLKAKKHRAKAKGTVYEAPTPKKMQDLWATELNFLLDKIGIKIYGTPALGSDLGKSFIKSIELVDKVDREVGTRVGETIHNLIGNENMRGNLQNRLVKSIEKDVIGLEKAGINRNKIMDDLQYVELDPAGQPIWNPSEISRTIDDKLTITRNSTDRPSPSPLNLERFGNLRRIFDDLASKDADLAVDAGYLQGYVPTMGKRTATPLAFEGKNKAENLNNAFFLKHKSNAYDPTKHETDFVQAFSRYANAYATRQTYGKQVPEVLDQIHTLVALGKQREADVVMDIFARTTGLRTKRNVAEMFAERSMSPYNHIIKDMGAQIGAPQGLADEVFKVVREAMYANLVFSNPGTLVKQTFQVPWVGIGEMGRKYVNRGVELWKNKAMKAEAMKAMDKMRALRTEFVEEMKDQTLTRRPLKVAKTILTAPSAPGKFYFNLKDMSNRGKAYLGAREMMRDAVRADGERGLVASLDGMLQSEKQIVLNTLKKHGMEEAIDTGSIIRSRRINYHYGVADRAQFLTGPAGDKIPFMTWSTNQIHRLGQDFREIATLKGAAKRSAIRHLATRIGMPLLYLNIFSALTGYKLPGALPAEAAMGALTPEIMPPVKQSIEDFKRTGSPGSAILGVAKIVTPYGPLRRIAKRLDKAESTIDAGAAALGFQKLKDTDRSYHSILRNLIMQNY